MMDWRVWPRWLFLEPHEVRMWFIAVALPTTLVLGSLLDAPECYLPVGLFLISWGAVTPATRSG